MKYSYLIPLFLLLSCTSVSVNKYEKPVFNSKGFAYIYSIDDYENKIIKRKIDNNLPLVAHKNIQRGVLLKITKCVINREYGSAWISKYDIYSMNF